MASWKIALEINRGLGGLATMILIVGIDLRIFFSPHHCVGFLFFAWIPPLSSRPPPPPRRTHHYSSLTHSSLTHSLTHSPHLTSLTHSPHSPHSLTHSLIHSLTHSPPSLTHSLTSPHLTSPHSLTHLTHLTHLTSPHLTSPHSLTHLTSLTHSLTQAGAVQRACLLRGRRTTQSLLAELRRAWPPLGPRLPLAWQAQYTEPPGRAAARVAAAGAAAAFGVQAQYTEPPGRAAARVAAAGAAAAFGVAGAVHRASWTSCGARGRRWGRGCLWRGRRSTQSLLDELRPPLGPRLPLAWQAQYTEPPGRAAARVAAAGAAAAFRVSGAVHRASWRSCGARGRRWGRGCLLRGSTQSLLDELRRAWPPLGPRLPFAWQAQYTEPPHHL